MTGDRKSSDATSLSLSVSLSLSLYLRGFFSSFFFLLRQVSVMRSGACEVSAGSLLTAKFLTVRENRKIGNLAARARWLGQAGPQLFEHEAPVGFPHIYAGSTPTLLPPLNSLTLPPHHHSQTRSPCFASPRA